MKKKKIIWSIAAVVAAVLIAAAGFTARYAHQKDSCREQTQEQRLTFCNLDHDIFVSDDSLTVICDDQKTGWSPSCGPSPASWPMAFPYKWEVLLAESSHFYFARLIFHEYVLWMSFDYPYVLCKIPKVRTTGDWATNLNHRYSALWDITEQFEHGWNRPATIKEPQIYNINGHKVSFAHDTFGYEKYVVVHDTDFPW